MSEAYVHAAKSAWAKMTPEERIDFLDWARLLDDRDQEQKLRERDRAVHGAGVNIGVPTLRLNVKGGG